MKPTSGLSRRRFIATACSTLGPLVLPSGVLAQPGRPGANDRIVTGHIGTGKRGHALLRRFRDHAIAVCDADERAARDAAAQVGSWLRYHSDYRELLDRADIDAVVIATPDHWHAMMAIQAIESGKAVYIETPLYKYLGEAEKLLETARRYSAVVHAGAEGPFTAAGRAAQAYWSVAHAAKAERVECWGAANPSGGTAGTMEAVPSGLNWDLWLGPARWAPYAADRVTGWPWINAYGAGNLGVQGTLAFTMAAACLGGFSGGEIEVMAEAAAPEGGLWDVPQRLEITYRWKSTGLTLAWRQPSGEPQEAPSGVLLHAADDSLGLVHCDAECAVEAKARELMADQAAPDAAAVWLDAVRLGRSEPLTLEMAADAAQLVALGQAAWRLGRPLLWDPAAGRFANDEAANRLVADPGRGEWRL